MNKISVNNYLQKHDCIVILSMSDFRNELNSNRHHFSKMFAREKPTIFINIQFGEKTLIETFKDSIRDIEIKLMTPNFLLSQRDTLILIKNFLQTIGYENPIFWIYNPFYLSVKEIFPNAPVFFHVTEDYFDFDRYPLAINQRRAIKKMIPIVDHWIFCTKTIAYQYVRKFQITSLYVFQNGVSIEYLDGFQNNYDTDSKKIAFIGNIDNRLNFKLILSTVLTLKEFDFIFYGPNNAKSRTWKKIQKQRNVFHQDYIDPDEFIECSSDIFVAWIPYRLTSYICLTSLPLKYYEFKSLGMSVVSVPIFNIALQNGNMYFAKDVNEMTQMIRKSFKEYNDSIRTENHKEALSMTYEDNFVDFLDDDFSKDSKQIESEFIQFDSFLDRYSLKLVKTNQFPSSLFIVYKRLIIISLDFLIKIPLLKKFILGLIRRKNKKIKMRWLFVF